eukprot:6651546-Prymnesium_polylepis.1
MGREGALKRQGLDSLVAPQRLSERLDVLLAQFANGKLRYDIVCTQSPCKHVERVNWLGLGQYMILENVLRLSGIHVHHLIEAVEEPDAAHLVEKHRMTYGRLRRF